MFTAEIGCHITCYIGLACDSGSTSWAALECIPAVLLLLQQLQIAHRLKVSWQTLWLQQQISSSMCFLCLQECIVLLIAAAPYVCNESQTCDQSKSGAVCAAHSRVPFLFGCWLSQDMFHPFQQARQSEAPALILSSVPYSATRLQQDCPACSLPHAALRLRLVLTTAQAEYCLFSKLVGEEAVG